MFRQSPCLLLAAFVAVKVSAQLDQLAPPGSGASAAQSEVDQAFAGMAECSCSCCQVTNRRELKNGASQQCASLDMRQNGDPSMRLLSSQCPAKCLNSDPSQTVLTNEIGTIDSARKCQMDCLPAKPEIGSKCRKLTIEELAKLLTSGGNGRGPSSLSQPLAPQPPEELVDPNAPPEPPQLSDQAALNEAQAAAPVVAAGPNAALAASAADKEKDKETGAMVAQASGKQAMAAGIEARITEAEASSAQSLSLANADMQSSHSASLMVTAARAQVQAAKVRAAIYAKSAAMAAARAEAELKEIKDIPRKVAQMAAEEAKSIVQGEVNEAANNLAIVKSRLAGPPLPVPLAEASVRAAQPYYNIMNKAIAMGNLYEASAHTLQDQAQTLQEQSRTVASQAVGYQTAGNGVIAQKLMAQAKGMLAEAQAKDAQARKDFSVAEGVRKQVPNYQANAALASARATSLANPGGQPPPAMAPKFLQLPSRNKMQF